MTDVVPHQGEAVMTDVVPHQGEAVMTYHVKFKNTGSKDYNN